jgi:hypothetical protein
VKEGKQKRSKKVEMKKKRRKKSKDKEREGKEEEENLLKCTQQKVCVKIHDTMYIIYFVN